MSDSEVAVFNTEFANMKRDFHTKNTVSFTGKKLKSLSVSYRKSNKVMTISISSRAERVGNFFSNRFGKASGTIHLNVASDEEFKDIALEIDNFLTMFYG